MKRLTAWLLVILLLLSALFTGCTGNEDPSTGNDPVCDHVDSDDNGGCDTCNQSVLVNLDFYAINDLHGKFRVWMS